MNEKGILSPLFAEGKEKIKNNFINFLVANFQKDLVDILKDDLVENENTTLSLLQEKNCEKLTKTVEEIATKNGKNIATILAEGFVRQGTELQDLQKRFDIFIKNVDDLRNLAPHTMGDIRTTDSGVLEVFYLNRKGEEKLRENENTFSKGDSIQQFIEKAFGRNVTPYEEIASEEEIPGNREKSKITWDSLTEEVKSLGKNGKLKKKICIEIVDGEKKRYELYFAREEHTGTIRFWIRNKTHEEQYLHDLEQALIKIAEEAKELAKANMQKDQLLKEKDRFLSIFAHDLKNPFNGVLGFLDLLTNENSDEMNTGKKKEILIFAKETAIDTYNLLEELLLRAKSKKEGFTIQAEQTDCAKTIEEVIKSLKFSSDLKEIKLNFLSAIPLHDRMFTDRNILKFRFTS